MTTDKNGNKPVKRKRGRPIWKYNPETVQLLCDSISKGLRIKDACYVTGISPETYYKWLEKYPDLKEKILQAEALAKMNLLQTMRNHSEKDYRATAFILERRWPEDFSLKTSNQHHHIGNVAMHITAEQTAQLQESLKRYEEWNQLQRTYGNGSVTHFNAPTV